MNISIATFYNWKSSYLEILEALKKGKEVVDFEVENALLSAAKSGNVAAQIFWLKNRRPDKWRDHPASADSVENDKLKKMRDLLGGVPDALE